VADAHRLALVIGDRVTQLNDRAAPIA
jgi:hypothetical protein